MPEDHRGPERSDAPKRRYEVIDRLAAQGFPARRLTGLLNVSESGFHAWRERPPSARRLRHVWLTRLILDIHRESGSAFGYRRIRQVLEHRFGIRVSHGTVELLMNQAGIRGRPGGHHERTGLTGHAVPSSCRATGILACRHPSCARGTGGPARSRPGTLRAAGNPGQPGPPGIRSRKEPSLLETARTHGAHPAPRR
ncbi:IS3 family transposase [Streptomyces fagopyri]|uniref:IS3 family transposase n=1 Tax=Streptomyces fagopyri TaxID=2662397 RepID=UPI0033E2604F